MQGAGVDPGSGGGSEAPPSSGKERIKDRLRNFGAAFVENLRTPFILEMGDRGLGAFTRLAGQAGTLFSDENRRRGLDMTFAKYPRYSQQVAADFAAEAKANMAGHSDPDMARRVAEQYGGGYPDPAALGAGATFGQRAQAPQAGVGGSGVPVGSRGASMRPPVQPGAGAALQSGAGFGAAPTAMTPPGTPIPNINPVAPATPAAAQGGGGYAGRTPFQTREPYVAATQARLASIPQPGEITNPQFIRDDVAAIQAPVYEGAPGAEIAPGDGGEAYSGIQAPASPTIGAGMGGGFRPGGVDALGARYLDASAAPQPLGAGAGSRTPGYGGAGQAPVSPQAPQAPQGGGLQAPAPTQRQVPGTAQAPQMSQQGGGRLGDPGSYGAAPEMPSPLQQGVRPSIPGQLPAAPAPTPAPAPAPTPAPTPAPAPAPTPTPAPAPAPTPTPAPDPDPAPPPQGPFRRIDPNDPSEIERRRQDAESQPPGTPSPAPETPASEEQEDRTAADLNSDFGFQRGIQYGFGAKANGVQERIDALRNSGSYTQEQLAGLERERDIYTNAADVLSAIREDSERYAGASEGDRRLYRLLPGSDEDSGLYTDRETWDDIQRLNEIYGADFVQGILTGNFGPGGQGQLGPAGQSGIPLPGDGTDRRLHQYVDPGSVASQEALAASRAQDRRFIPIGLDESGTPGITIEDQRNLARQWPQGPQG